MNDVDEKSAQKRMADGLRWSWAARWAGILQTDTNPPALWTTTTDGRHKLGDDEIEATVALWRSWGIDCRPVRRSEVMK